MGEHKNQLGPTLHQPRQAALQPTMVSYCSVLSTFEKSGKWQLALVLFDSLPKSKLRPTVAWICYDLFI